MKLYTYMPKKAGPSLSYKLTLLALGLHFLGELANVFMKNREKNHMFWLKSKVHFHDCQCEEYNLLHINCYEQRAC